MKKLKLLLLALAVIALIVAGITVTVSADAVADTTILTVNGEEYSAVPESIPDGAVVLGYKPCENVPYNPNATYEIAPGAASTSIKDRNRISSLIVNEAEGKVHYGGSSPATAEGGWSKNVNVEEYMLTSDKEGDITVTIYSNATIPYNSRANYVLDFDSFTQVIIAGSNISFNQNASVSIGATNVLISLKPISWRAVAAAKTATILIPAELPYTEYSNIKVPASYNLNAYKAIDRVNGYLATGKNTDDNAFTDDTVVTLGKLGVDYVFESNVTYELAAGLNPDYYLETESTFMYNTYGENGANLKSSFQYSAADINITLYTDLYIEGSGAFATLGKSGTTQTFCLDLNGKKFTYRDIKDPTDDGSSAFSTMFTLYGNIDTYIVSSEAGGTLTFYNKHRIKEKIDGVYVLHDPYESSSPLFYPVANAKVTIGGATINGEEIDGDNLSVYAGGLFAFSNNIANVKANVNGGYYYSIGDARQCAAIAFGRYGEGSVISYSNAKIYSETGMFFRTYSGTDSGVYNFDNCVFYSPSTGGFNMHSGATLNISNSYLPTNAHISGTGLNVTIDNCVATTMTANTAAHVTYNSTISNSLVKTFDGFKKPAFAYNEESGHYEASIVDMGALTYTTWVGNSVFKHNITLTADIVYNLYVPVGINSVTINGKDYAAKRYNDLLNVVSITVGAKNVLDVMNVVANAGKEATLTVTVMDYINQVLEAYKDDVHLVGVLNAVKDYTKAASAYFGYNVDAFNYEYFYNELVAKKEGDGIKMAQPTAAFLEKITGAKLRLNNEIAFVFGVAENATGEVSVSYYYNNKLVTKTVSLDGKSELVVPVKAIDLNKGVTITVGEDTLNYNLQNYIYNTAKKTGLENYAALMLLLSHMDNYAENACYGHVAGDPITANYTVLKNELGCYSYDTISCCVNCGKVMNSETVIHAHGETEEAKINEVKPEAFKDGSYDIAVQCTECEYVVSSDTVTLPSLMSYFTYTENGDGTYTITGVEDIATTATEIIVPECVSEIAKGALAEATSIVSITLPFVGKNATTSDQAEGCFGYIFGASTYTDNNTTVPQTLKNVTVTAANKIVANAFRGCSKLSGTIIFNEGITSIGGTAFYTTPITTVIIPKSVTSIAGQSFAITSMNLKVYYLGTEEQWTTKLKPGAQTGSGKDYFRLEEKVYSNVAYPANIFFSAPETPVLGATYWAMIDGVPTTYVFDGTVPHDQHIPAEPVVENEIPAGCNGGSYESVVYCSVYGCNHEISRTTVYTDPVHTPAEAVKKNEVPTSPTVAGSYDLVVYCSGCGTELSRTTETIPTYSSDFTYAQNEDGTWAVTGLSESGAALTAVVIPDGITAIADNAFKGNTVMTSVVIPASVKSIGASAFENASKLASVTIADGVESIGNSAFSNSAITSAVVPSSVTTMGTGVFYLCKKLVTVDIQANIETLPTSTIRDCWVLKLAILPESLKYIDGAYAFNNTGADNRLGGTIILPSTFVKFNSGSGTYNSKAAIFYNGTAEDWAANVGKELTSWQGSAACTSRLYFYSEETPTTEGYYWHYVDGTPNQWAALDDIDALAPYYYYSNNDGTYTISGLRDKSLTSLEIPACVSKIGASAFASTNLVSVTLEEGTQLKTIDADAFAGSKLEFIDLRNAKVTTFNARAFYNIKKHLVIYLPEYAAGDKVAFPGESAGVIRFTNNISIYYGGTVDQWTSTSGEYFAKSSNGTILNSPKSLYGSGWNAAGKVNIYAKDAEGNWVKLNYDSSCNYSDSTVVTDVPEALK